jgi:hypothetical protein
MKALGSDGGPQGRSLLAEGCQPLSVAPHGLCGHAFDQVQLHFGPHEGDLGPGEGELASILTAHDPKRFALPFVLLYLLQEQPQLGHAVFDVFDDPPFLGEINLVMHHRLESTRGEGPVERSRIEPREH